VWCHRLITRIDNKQPETPRCNLLCDSHSLTSSRGWPKWRGITVGMIFFPTFSPLSSLSDSLICSLPHCIFPSLGNDKGKWGSRPLYVPPRFKLASALVTRHDRTVEQEISFFIGWLVTLLRLLMSKRTPSALSRFNLTEWRVRVYLITAAQALLSAVTVPRRLDPRGSPGVWFKRR